MRFLILTLLLLASFTAFGQTNKSRQKYDVAAYIWPAYFNEPRFQSEMGIFHDGKGEVNGRPCIMLSLNLKDIDNLVSLSGAISTSLIQRCRKR